jgi:hypothetical protein
MITIYTSQTYGNVLDELLKHGIKAKHVPRSHSIFQNLNLMSLGVQTPALVNCCGI